MSEIMKKSFFNYYYYHPEFVSGTEPSIMCRRLVQLPPNTASHLIVGSGTSACRNVLLKHLPLLSDAEQMQHVAVYSKALFFLYFQHIHNRWDCVGYTLRQQGESHSKFQYS